MVPSGRLDKATIVVEGTPENALAKRGDTTADRAISVTREYSPLRAAGRQWAHADAEPS